MSPEPWLDARALLLAANATWNYPIEWPNEPFSVPNADDGVIWLSVEGFGDSYFPVEMGTPTTWLEEGTLFVSVMVPVNAGTLGARTAAKAVANVFRDLPGPRYTVYRRGMIAGGREIQREGSWYCLPVQIEWTYTDKAQP